MPELKPCPFCGSEAKINELENPNNGYSIRCAEKNGWCETIPETWRYSTTNEAIEAWNKRSK